MLQNGRETPKGSSYCTNCTDFALILVHKLKNKLPHTKQKKIEKGNPGLSHPFLGQGSAVLRIKEGKSMIWGQIGKDCTPLEWRTKLIFSFIITGILKFSFLSFLNDVIF